MASPLDRLRAIIRQRGEDSNQGVGRKFRMADKDNNKMLSRDEFSMLLERQGLVATDQEEEQLWQMFDRDRNGYVNYAEFILTLRGNMNPFRRKLVDMVFNKFDRDSNGTVDIYEIRSSYDPSGVTGVVASDAKKNAYENYKDFLVQFGDTNRDGQITRAEFQAYYDGVSATID